MAKTKIEFICRECGSSHHQWAGQCLDCKEWNTLEEVVISQATSSKPESLKDLPASKVQNLSEIKSIIIIAFQPVLVSLIARSVVA